MVLRFNVCPIAAVLLLAACGGAPQAPSRPVPPAQVPVVPWVAVEGPSVVPIGETVQFRAVARLSDGSSRDVTNDATWSSAGFVSISGPGLVMGQQQGSTWVQARFEGLRGLKYFLVLPAGTFSLYGRVVEAGYPEGGLSSAQVDVVSGVGTGQSARTDWWGGFRLLGLAGEVGLRVSRAGYQPTVHGVAVTDQPTTANLELPLAAPRADISGTYTLTLAAADECGTGLGQQQLPEEIKVRTYGAVVRQNGPTAFVAVSGAGGFEARVYPGEVAFDSTWYDGEQPAFAEILPLEWMLVVSGSVGPVPPDRLAGALRAGFFVFDGPSPWLRSVAWCHSQRHQFALSR